MKRSKNRLRRLWRQQWLLRRDRKRFQRKHGHRGGGSGFCPWLHGNEFTKGSIGSTRDRRIIIHLPEVLDFEENYERTVSHFDLLRRGVHSGGRLAYVNFDSIREISPSAALVLASEVDRWNQLRGGRLRAIVDNWHEEIRRLLRQMGYFELLNIGAPPVATNGRSDPQFLRFKRGDENDRNAGALAKQLRVEIEELVGFGIKRHLLFEGLSEAITNVGQHAYPGENTKVRQWWLSLHCV